MPQQIPGPLVYESGKSNSDARAIFSGMPLDVGQVNPDYNVFFDDFTVLHGKAMNQTDMYDVVKDAGAGVAIADVLNGIIRLSSTATTDTDGALVQMVNGVFARTAGKKLWFEASLKVSDIDNEIFIGLAEQVGTNPENVVAATTHRLGIQVAAGDTAGLLLASNGDGTTADTTSLGANMVAATYKKLGFYYDGSTVSFYVDRTLKLSGVVPRPASGTDLMGLACYSLSGNATGTHTLDLDYWMIVAER